MKKLLTILTVFLFQFSFSQSSDFVRPTVSFVIAPYSNVDDIGTITDGSFAAFDLLKLQNGQLGINANPKKNKVTDEYNEAATNVAKSIFVPTPSVHETIKGSLILILLISNKEPKPPITSLLKDLFVFLTPFLDILDICLTSSFANEIFTPLFL